MTAIPLQKKTLSTLFLESPEMSKPIVLKRRAIAKNCGI
jgi:hypothetical protein